MATWMRVDDPHALLARASSPCAWQEAELEEHCGTATLHPVAWERSADTEHWVHDVLWCPRTDGARVAIQRLTPRARSVEALAGLVAHARDEMSMASDDQVGCSNVGGFHGERDLWGRPAVAVEAPHI